MDDLQLSISHERGVLGLSDREARSTVALAACRPHFVIGGSALRAALFIVAGLGFWNIPAAADDSAAAMLREQAQALEHGEGVARSPLLAVEKYCEAARIGDAESQYRLGWMYANGRGVSRDDALAAYFFKLAAQQGDQKATEMLRYVGHEVASPPSCMTIKDPDGVAEKLEVASEDYVAATASIPRRISELVHRLAPQYGVTPGLALAVIRAESNFNPLAVSPKNAQGLMQLIPETAARFNVRKPFDPEQNIRGGLAYLRWLLAYFKGNIALVAAGYNAGERAVERFRGIPPYPETRDYVKRIRTLFRSEHHPYDPDVAAPSPELPSIRLRTM